MTRKSIRPKRLFQSEAQKLARELEKEEEAATEIEDNEKPEIIDAPLARNKSTVPEKHGLRSTAGPQETEIVTETATNKVKTNKRKTISPFDSWKRVKAGSSAPSEQLHKGRKRGAAEALEEGESSGKKAKST